MKHYQNVAHSQRRAASRKENWNKIRIKIRLMMCYTHEFGTFYDADFFCAYRKNISGLKARPIYYETRRR